MVGVRNTGRSREEFPEVAEEIGEDPARFLDYPLLASSARGSSPFQLAKARIQGIEYKDVVARWLYVERRLERGPRERVLELLKSQMAHLEEHGERDDQPRADPSEVPSTKTHARFLDENGNERDRTSSAASKMATLRADGGEQR